MKTFSLPAFTLVTLCALWAQAGSQSKKELPVEKIDAYLTAGVAQGFSGAFLIAQDGKVLLSKGYGFAHEDSGRANTPDTVFDIGSNTKQFTATAMLKLVQQGKLNLSDNLSQFFKNVPKDKKTITVHQLLTHTAGLPTYSGSDFDAISLEDFIARVFEKELLSQPGTKFHYSNVGYSLLAMILEQVAEQPYEAFLQKHLFEPAGMTQTGYLAPAWDKGILAHGYQHTIRDIGTVVDRYESIGVTWHLKGNGGLQSTVKDLHKWHLVLNSDRILPSELKEKLFTAYPLKDQSKPRYGYGWALRKTDENKRVVFHNGANPFYFCEMIWSLDDGVEVVYLSNARTDEAEKVAWQVQKALFDPNFELKPMKPSIYRLVWNFMEAHNPKEKAELKALVTRELGDTPQEKSLFNRLGLWKVGRDETAWGLELLKMNTALFPEDGNLWDSLGEGYVAAGNHDQALQAFKKSLDLAPQANCGWCDNARKQIAQLEKTGK